MSDESRTVPMYLINPGTAAPDGAFAFEMQAQSNAARTVRFSLTPQDANLLREALAEYFKVKR